MTSATERLRVLLADRYGIDLQSALDTVEKHNRERGRYGE